jgi:hypothetical protein
MRSNSHPLAGDSEAFYHLHPQFKLKPMVARHRGQTHWWLECDGAIIDLTSEQFDRPFPYHLGHGCGFLTKQPSRRAKAIMEVLERKS